MFGLEYYTGELYDEFSESDYVNLQHVFGWRCDVLISQGTDGVACGNEADQFSLYPFVIIHHEYPSRLIK